MAAEETLHEYVIRRLHETKGQWPKVAKRSGVHYKTLEKIARREVSDPGVSYCEKLAKYFRKIDSATRAA